MNNLSGDSLLLMFFFSFPDHIGEALLFLGYKGNRNPSVVVFEDWCKKESYSMKRKFP